MQIFFSHLVSFLVCNITCIDMLLLCHLIVIFICGSVALIISLVIYDQKMLFFHLILPFFYLNMSLHFRAHSENSPSNCAEGYHLF
jgi:hypothetical protein